MKNRECNIFRVQNLCSKHTTRARSAKSLTAGVQGPLKGPGSSGYFRSSVVVSDAFLTPIFPGRSELLLCDFSIFFC
jgi:hypothetical protein